jgi:GNAT superfamily N-acetyltransferase
MFIDIEYASYMSWPALEQVDRDGWILRFAGGYTKRANSVNVLSVEGENILQRIVRCEEEYSERNLPCVFRLLSFNDNTPIETILDQRNYSMGDHSLVMVQDIRNKVFPSFKFRLFSPEDWLPIYCRLNGRDAADQPIHIKMIRSIQYPVLYAVLSENNEAVSCALGVVCHGYFGLFDMVTHPDYRNRSYGTKLIIGMLSWAKQQGASIAYLQVVAENRPAVGLYSKLGYQPGYEYHYRIQYYEG